MADELQAAFDKTVAELAGGKAMAKKTKIVKKKGSVKTVTDATVKTADDRVSLADLAKEFKLAPQSARVKLRNADLSPPEGSRWSWKKGSKELKLARDVLGGKE